MTQTKNTYTFGQEKLWRFKFLKLETGDLLMNNLPDLKGMSRTELRQYISDNRNNDEIVRAAIAESSSRPGWTEVPADITTEQEENIISDLIGKKSN